MTIYVGADRVDAAKNALEAAARKCKLIELTPVRIDQSDEFIKTLFVQFAVNAELRKINGIIRDTANDSSQYRIKTALEFAVQEFGSRNPVRTSSFNRRSAF